jgi:WD40 repeat protein
VVRTVKAHKGFVWGLAFIGEMRRVVSASADRTAAIIDLDTGSVVRTLIGHTDGVNGVAVSADGAMAVTIPSDHSARVWDVKSGIELSRRTLGAGVMGVAVGPDDAAFAVGVVDGLTHLLDAPRFELSGRTLVDWAKQSAPRCLTPDQRRRYHLEPEHPSWCRSAGKWPARSLR